MRSILLVCWVLSSCGLSACSGGGNPPSSPGPKLLTATSSWGGQPVTVSTSSQYGGAIYSITWGSTAFIDHTDHGRELQSAYQLDNGGEQNNPTEAGSAPDGANTSSSSHIILQSINGTNQLVGQSNPAYWYPVNGQLFTADVFQHIDTLTNNVIHHQRQVTLAAPHTTMSMEGITIYTGTSFNQFYLIKDGQAVQAQPPSNGGLQNTTYPVILSDGVHAIGCKSVNPVYQNWYGLINVWPKIDCAWFQAAPASGVYSWEAYTAIGNLADVVSALK